MKKSIKFPFEAQYSLSHEPAGNETDLWVLFHGYGQLSEFFIRKFLLFDNDQRLFLAPEGTNYQYLSGFEGRVGANWMTKYERETAIANNQRYLDQLMEEILGSFEKLPKIHVLGFSQGAATASRWASQWSGKISTLVLWAGGFAHDMKIEGAKEKFFDTKITMIYGNQDEFLTPESIQKQEEWLSILEKKPEKITFEGGHELNEAVLEKFFKK
ncbi:alpha/beta hydrolase [Algoriphagus hitonicola]|uniref:Predicted esterase n=1 Tax=Algoriphagus hitonicola TaxID=435880 RepID=A0A1I2W4N3_9BACT|nr:alpha/beta hydrolase [Algoriphagus hitonicola]SFG96354.1 Predicted esterase [Algoriphagus hitonicola]